MIKSLHIVCYQWGERYGVEYVNKLRAMVARNLSIPHTFHCLTDNPAHLRDDIVPHQLPEKHYHGNWNKLMTFQPNFLKLEGQLLVSLDIDLVIVDNIDFLADNPEDDFKICGRNWVKGGHRGSGSVYRLRVGTHAHVWEEFAENPEWVMDRFHTKSRQFGEQNWLNSTIEKYTWFPDEKIVSFKRHCKAKGYSLFGKWGEEKGLTTANIGKATLPPGAAIVAFHGNPKPPDVMNHRCGRWRHAPFVREHWYEDLKREMLNLTVVIPVFNRQRLLIECLEAIAAQTQPVDKIVVVDDASEDQTVEVVENWRKNHPDCPLLLLKQPVNMGVSYARNRGAEYSVKGGLVAFVDSDDLWPDDLAKRAREAFATFPEWVAASSDRNIIHYGVPGNVSRVFKQSSKDWARDGIIVFLEKRHCGTSNTIFRVDAFRESGGFPHLRAGQDYLTFVKIAKAGPWGFIPGDPVQYRYFEYEDKGQAQHLSALRSPFYLMRRIHLLQDILQDEPGGSLSFKRRYCKAKARCLARHWIKLARRCNNAGNKKRMHIFYAEARKTGGCSLPMFLKTLR